MLSFCLTYGMFFDFDYQYGLSCEPVVYCPRNIVSTISRSVLFGIVVMNFVIFGYFLHEMRHLWFQGNRNQVFNHSRKPSRTLRKISLIVGLFLVGFFPFITLYAFPILDMKVGIGKDIYLLTTFFWYSIVLVTQLFMPCDLRRQDISWKNLFAFGTKRG